MADMPLFVHPDFLRLQIGLADRQSRPAFRSQLRAISHENERSMSERGIETLAGEILSIAHQAQRDCDLAP